MPDSTVEGTRTTFAKGEKVTPINILHERVIGQGRFGVVTEADVLVHGRNRKFVIKRFKDSPHLARGVAKANATRAMENYQTAKAAGLRVFPTYRLGEDGKSILMTNANLDSCICVDIYSSNSLPAQGFPLLVDIDEKVEKLADTVFQQSRIAAERGVGLYVDAFFFLVDKDTKDLDFVIGDLDLINDVPISDHDARLQVNLTNALGALTNFVKYNVADSDRYKERIRNMFFDAQMQPQEP